MLIRKTAPVALAVGLSLNLPLVAQPATAQPAPANTQQNAATQKLPVDLSQALYLIRSTLLTLNDANRSGNYTVLRDLAAPAFQARNSAADLALNFVDLRQRRFDLFGAALLAPTMTAQPQLDANGMLRLTGFFPTRPLQIDFDLLFQNVDGHWLLFGISIATPPAAPLPQVQQQPAKKPANR
ncbi:MAG TPA: hypothetical protein VNR39_04005 [Pseudolabrys sp.]|nr:hypothetical protein [Pseudolabrys sp.]